jgi:hypothetical protein
MVHHQEVYVQNGGAKNMDVAIERKNSTIVLTGLAYAKRITIDCDAHAYKIEWLDGAQPSSGKNESWDSRTLLRYALLAYRNGLNARLSEAIWPRESRVRNQRASLIRELAQQQAQQQALLLALAKKLGALEPGK